MPDPRHRKDDDSDFVFGEPARQLYRCDRRRRRSNETEFNFKSEPRCLTLEEDEISRCGRLVSKPLKRCQVHQAQYRTIYLKYKTASRRAEDLQQTDRIPSMYEIEGYCDLDVILRKIEHVDKYLQLVQIEKIGRDIHGRRFFLERVFIQLFYHLKTDYVKLLAVGDYRHRARLDILEKEVKRSSEAFLALKGRANSIFAERLYRRQRDSSQGDSMDRSGSLGDDTSGTTLRRDQASQSEFAETTGRLTNDSDTAAATNLGADHLIEIEATALADLLYASVDYFFSK